MPSDSALDRVARLIDLIPYLASREGRTADIAARLQVSVEDLERDLEIAFLCGLPGYTPDLLIDLHLEEGQVLVTEPQVLVRPRRFTSSEISALLLGLEIIETSFGTSKTIRECVKSIRKKLDVSQEIDHVMAEIDSVHQAKMALLETGINSPSRISFTYVDSLGTESKGRIVTPWEIVVRGGRLLVRGFDHNHREPRDFFIGSISNLVLIEGEPIPRSDAIATDGSAGKEPVCATLIFENLPFWWIRRYSPFIDRWEVKGDETVVEVRYWKSDWLWRALVPVIDHLANVDAQGLSDQLVREEILSYLSASAGPVE